MRARFTAFGIARLAHLGALAGTALLAASGCGDESAFQTATFRLLGPPPPTIEGRCPSPAEDTSLSLAGADRVRLTYRRANAGALVCDVVLPIAGGNRVVAIPDGSGTPAPLDLYVEVFGDLGAGPVLLGRGETAGALISETSVIDVEIGPSDAFACSQTQPMVARAFHTITPLPGGALLIAGGVAAPSTGDDAVDPAVGDLFAIGELEIYDPVKGTTSRLSAPVSARAMHTAVLLSSDPIRIALIGGLTVNGDPAATPVLRTGADTEAFRLMPGALAIAAPTEIVTYDAERQTATTELVDEVVTRGIMSTAWPRRELTTGNPPVIVGGWTDPTAAADELAFEVIDPVTAARVTTGALVGGRVGASVSGLGNGSALVWGGHLDMAADVSTAAGELLVDLGGTPASTPLVLAAGSAQPAARAFHRAIQVAPGRFLIVGGFAAAAGLARNPAANHSQLVDVSTEVTVTDVVSGTVIPTPVGYGEAIAFAGGDVLIAGGNPASDHPGCEADPTGLVCATNEALLFRAGNRSLSSTGGLQVARYGHRAALLADGRVVVTGGLHASDKLKVIADAELYDPRSADDDPIADLRPDIVRAAGDIARDASTLDPVAECRIIAPP